MTAPEQTPAPKVEDGPRWFRRFAAWYFRTVGPFFMDQTSTARITALEARLREAEATIGELRADNSDLLASADADAMMLSNAQLRIDKLVDGLRPFAAIYDESMHDFPDGSAGHERPDGKQAWGFNNADLTWGDFRRARTLLKGTDQ